MRRRDFIKVTIGSAAAWPLAARAQQSAMPTVGFLNAGSAQEWAHLAAAFRDGLGETGYTEGRNVSIQYRWAEGKYDRLPGLAADLVQRRVTVIATGGSAAAARAAKGATATIPIVYTSGDDPVRSGLVSSVNQPAGNITGVSSFIVPLGPKQLDLLRELTHASRIAVLVNPNSPIVSDYLRDLRTAAEAHGQQLLIVEASSDAQIAAAFAGLVESRAEALIVTSDPVLVAGREKVVALAARNMAPTIYSQREFTEIGGLISYGVNFRDVYRKLGDYAGRILKGAKPADLPVLLPTKFELIINLITAKALGLSVPPTLLALADEVIE
jgi:putative ABC transport system substrate-binding protein